MIVKNLGAKPLVIQVPIGAEEEFAGVVDLVENKAIVWNGEELGASFEYQEIPDDLKEKCEETSVEDLKKCIRKGCINLDFVPVACGSAFKNKGVQPLLDAVLDYLPAPTDLPDVNGSAEGDAEKVMARKPSDDEPFAGLAFKVMTDPFVGTLTFVRVYSGVMESGSYVYNSVKGKKERVGRMMEMHANDRNDVKACRAGDIIAIAGLKDTTTGDTLCDSDKTIVLERMEFPDPVIKVAIEPKTKADLEKMSQGLVKLAAEDPSFHFTRDEETNQTVIEGMGELHVEIIVDRLKREFKVEADVGAPQVNYRESISKPASIKYTHKKQSGGSGQYADVQIKFEPLEPGSGFEFATDLKGGSVPKEYIPGVEKGLKDSMMTGVIAGFPVVDVRATLFDGGFHDVDSSVMAFEIAAKAAFKEGIPKCAPKLLEPMMQVDVICPEESMGDVIGDLNSRRGQIGELGDKPGGLKTVLCFVPLAEMFNYVSKLRGMTRGRANYSMKLARYEPVPMNIQQELQKAKTEKSAA